MAQYAASTSSCSRYTIRVKGHLDATWTDCLDGWMLEHQEGGETLLTSDLIDQAALHGALNRLRDLKLVIVSVLTIE